MKSTNTFIHLRPLFVAFVLLTQSLFHLHHAQGETAARSDDFVDSIGINIKLNRTVYINNWTIVRDRLEEIGIRHYRDFIWLTDNPTYLNRFNYLYDELGMQMLGLWGPWEYYFPSDPNAGHIPSNVVQKAITAKRFLHAIEGPNEPDLFWDSSWPASQFGGFTSVWDQSRWYMNQMYSALKANGQTSSFPVVGIALAFTDNAANLGPHSHDRIGCHIYKHQDQMLLWNWEDKVENQRIQFNSTKSTYMTEAGYNTMNNGIGASELAQMKMTTQIIAANFRFNSTVNPGQNWIGKTYIHQLMNESTNPNDENGTWGLVKYNGANKPAFYAVKHLISLLGEGTWNKTTDTWQVPNFTPGSLNFTLSTEDIGFLPYCAGGSRIERRLLQKSNGEFYLLTWLDADPWNEATKTDNNSSLNRTLSLGQNCKVEEFRLNGNGDFDYTLLSNNTSSLSINIPDYVLVLRITPQGSGGPSVGPWYKIRNQGHGGTRNLTALSSSNSWNVTTTTNTGWWTDWRLVNASSNYYYFRNRGHSGNRNLRAGGSGANWNVNSSTNTLDWEQWRLIDVGGGYYNLRNKGHSGNRNLRAGNSGESWNVNTTTGSFGWEKWRFIP